MYIHHYQHVHDWKLNLEHPNIELLFQTEKKDRSSTCGGVRRFQQRKQTKTNYAFGCLNMVINIPRRRNILHIRQINGTLTVIEMELYKEFKMVGFCVFYFLFFICTVFAIRMVCIYWIEAAGPNMFNPRLFLWLCFHFHLVSVGFWCLSLSLKVLYTKWQKLWSKEFCEQASRRCKFKLWYHVDPTFREGQW